MNNIEIPWDVIEEAAYDAGLNLDSDIRLNYSGRSMYGRTCFGIIGSMSVFAEFLLAVERSDCGDEYANPLADRVTTDSMGYDTIFYFPGVVVVDAPDDDTEDC